MHWACVHTVSYALYWLHRARLFILIMLLSLLMERASDTVGFDPLVISFNTGGLIGDVSKDRELSNPPALIIRFHVLIERNILSQLVSQIEFRLHTGKFEFTLWSTDTKTSDHLLFSCLFFFITTCQTSCNKLVATASLSPFISCQLSRLQRQETRTGSHNRVLGGGQCLCTRPNEWS